MEIVNHEYFVHLEVAKLLKEAGFDWKCNGVFISEDGTQYTFIKMDAAWDSNNSKYNQYNISAPTLEVAQRWLREVKGILLYMTPKRVNMEWKWNFWYIDLRDKTNIEQRYSTKNFNTYEKAQEAGIKKALELL